MPSPEENHKQPFSSELTLRSLQKDLAKSNQIYKWQENKFKQLRLQENQLKQNSQNNSKPSVITFKKPKSQ